MSRAFWTAAFSGTITAALVISQLSLSRTEAGMIVAVLINTLFWLAIIDIFVVKGKE
jgi:hypothetical protein